MMRASLYSFLALICFVNIISCDDDVLDFSSKDLTTFKDDIAKFDVALVEFFAPWCGHCKRLAPEYAKAATILKAEPTVPLVKVDCTSDGGKDICQEYGVSGYPTLKIFKATSESPSEYSGSRDVEGIVKHMRSKVGSPSTPYSSYADIQKHLESIQEAIIVGIFKDETSGLYQSFLKTAESLRHLYTFRHVFTKTVKDASSTVKIIPDIKEETIFLVRPQMMKNKFEPSYVSFDEKPEKLEKFIQKNIHGLVGHRTNNNIQEFNAPLVVAFYNVNYKTNPKGTNYWRNRILKVAEKYTKTNFAVSNFEQFRTEMDEFGLEFQDSREAAPLVSARNDKGEKFVMSEKFSVEALEKFVQDFEDGNLSPFMKSESIPDDNSGPVKVAVAKNFKELVLESKKDVLIEFYAPWCGHCKKLAPVYEELGKLMEKETDIEIVKMDATANDVDNQFVVHGFPTIFFYPSDTKTAKKYEGGRETKDFVKYLAKHATKELKGYTRDGIKKKEEL